MSAFNRRNGRLRPACAGLVIVGLTGGAARMFCVTRAPHLTFSARPARAAAPMPRLTPVVWQTPDAISSQPPQKLPAVKIAVDSGTSQPDDLAALRLVFARTVQDSAGGSIASQVQEVHIRDLPEFEWGHLGAGRIAARVTASSDLSSDALGVYAVRSENGVTVCLVNRADARLNTTVATRLPRGVYTIERLTERQEKQEKEKDGTRLLSLPNASSNSSSSDSSFNASSSSAFSSASSVERLEQLEGYDLGATGVVSKPLCLEPHQMCLYRYMDVARTARASWQEVFGQLGLMARDHAAQARRLGTMLHEADGYVSGVRGETRHNSLESRLGCVHHLLLVTAQAHSLHHNYQMRHTVDETEGRAVMAALDRLTDALSETSATLLGLVPQIDVTPLPAPSSTQTGAGANPNNAVARPASFPLSGLTGKANKKEETEGSAPNLRDKSKGAGTAANERAVTVTVANTGTRTVGNVKLGLNMNLLPFGMTCEPSDPAYFGALGPGQTIRATFHLRAKPGQTLHDMPIVGDVSYFAGTAPAHLRPRVW